MKSPHWSVRAVLMVAAGALVALGGRAGFEYAERAEKKRKALNQRSAQGIVSMYRAAQEAGSSIGISTTTQIAVIEALEAGLMETDASESKADEAENKSGALETGGTDRAK